MFCPKCKDEFRPGFTRCGRCNVDLVATLPSPSSESGAPARAASALLRMGEYCGFLSLDEARHARDRLRERGIHSEIAIRESPEASWDEPVREEYWLRVDASRRCEVAAALGGIPEVEGDDAEEDSGFACGACGQQVAANETFCPKCGARFDD